MDSNQKDNNQGQHRQPQQQTNVRTPGRYTEGNPQRDQARNPARNPERNDGRVLRLIPLGGVGDVTKNMYIYEYGNDIIIVDCGVAFPSQEMLGVDLVIPDITYLRDKKHKIRGIIISHGHDDHIGGLPYIWPELDVPIYSQKLTCGMIRSRFTEFGLPKDKIKAVSLNDTLRLGAFEVTFYQVSHSIPDSTGIVIRTPLGVIFHQADFKMDWTPVNGQVTDVQKIARLASPGVLLLNVDCLRVERPGYTLSERTIEGTFDKVVQETPGKVLITMTSSNITRIQQAINVAVKQGRKMSLAGRSLENNFQVARDLGYLDVPPNLMVPQEELKRIPDSRLVILIAGSQGQSGSALDRVSHNDHKFIRLKKNDSVVFSADPIPLTEMEQYALIDTLTRLGCKVYYSANESDLLHTSGHASQEELKVMVSLVKPKFIMPIGGEFRHMKAFSNMAKFLGYREEQVLQPQDGDILELRRGSVQVTGHIDVSNVYVDGFGVGDVGEIVLRDRQVMSEDGVVVVIVSFDHQKGEIVGTPDIISRGFVYEKEAEDLIDASKEIVLSIFRELQKPIDWRYLRHQIEENLERFYYEETKRRPLVVTVVVDL